MAAEQLAAGWRAINTSLFVYGDDKNGDAPKVWQPIASGIWCWSRDGVIVRDGESPSREQAMCAALGLPHAYQGPEADAYAREALERHHTAQQSARDTAEMLRAERDAIREAALALIAGMRPGFDPALARKTAAPLCRCPGVHAVSCPNSGLRRFGPRGIDTTPLREPPTASPAPAPAIDMLATRFGPRDSAPVHAPVPADEPHVLAALREVRFRIGLAASSDVERARLLRHVALQLEAESAQLRAAAVRDPLLRAFEEDGIVQRGAPELSPRERFR